MNVSDRDRLRHMLEAASRVSPERRAATQGIAWARVVGTRHRVIYAYFDVDLEVIWSTVTLDLPELFREPEGALRQAGRNNLFFHAFSFFPSLSRSRSSRTSR